MIEKISRFVLLTAFVFSVHYCNAQKRYLFRTYTTTDGLINNTIFSINQDRNGYLWFGTDAGVSKFNGYNFDNNVIPEINKNEVFCQYIDKDRNGRLIISTFMEGILVEQGNSSYKQYLVQKKSIGKNVVRITKACPNGTVLTSLGHTLYSFKNDSFSMVYNFAGTNRTVFNTIECDSHENIWFGGFQGLGIIFSNDKTHTPFFFPELKDILVLNILFEKNNVLLVGSQLGFYRFTFKSTQRGKLQYTVEKPFSKLNDVTINHLYKDRQQNIWISTSTLGVFKTRNNKIIDHISFENGLPSSSVMCVFQDTENNYWFGTPDGVSKLVSFANYSLSYQGQPLKGVGLFSRDKYDRLWIWDGTSLYISKNDSVKNLKLNNTPFEDEGIESLLLTQSDVLIFTPSGLYKMPLKENVNLSNAKKITDFEKADVSRIRCTEIDSDGNIWIGFDQGLYSIRNNKLIKCEIRSQKEITLRPVQIVKDKYGYYWVGDFSFGLYRLKRDNTTGDKIVFDKMNEYKSLKADSAFVTAWVQDMMIDHNGDLWMSSLYTGVYKLSINKSGVTKAHLYSSQNGLSSNSITQLVEDKKHNMWFAGPNGAVRMIRANDKKETFTYYNSRNGLGRVVYDILPGDDVACLGFAEGFYVVDINRKDVVNTPPKVTLSNIAVLGKTDSLAMHSTGICKLRHNQNFIAFDFASISFARENAILYQYRLLGLDDKWSNYSDRKFVTYNSLKPGRYAFQVRSRAVDGNQASEITEFAFRIRPPFYQTWWFVGLSTLLVITIVYLLYQYRIKQLLKLERLRSRIASDLHDDIGSTLSSISILSELLQTQLDANPRSSEMIRKIGSNARNMLESMDDIIWAVNPSNDKFRNLELRIREYAIPLLESKDINFTFSTPAQLNSLPIPMHVRRNVYLIAKEAINNLIKYSNCTEARIEFKENHTMLTMNISDNGKGFDTNVPTDRNGVKNMKQRAEQINAGITIHSAMQQGTQIELSIKII